MDSEKKDVGKWWIWLLFLFVISIVVLTGLSYVGLFGKTVVERKVFENSFQYSESRKTEIAMFNAQLVEIERKLMNTNLDENTRINLDAQASALRVRLSVARSK